MSYRANQTVDRYARRVAANLVADFVSASDCGHAASFDRLEAAVIAAVRAAVDLRGAAFLVEPSRADLARVIRACPCDHCEKCALIVEDVGRD